MRFTHIDINLVSYMMVTKNPPNVHRKYFWAILLTFIFDIKIDINICEPHYVNLFFLWTSSIVCMFDLLIFDIFFTTWHLFDILTHQLNLNHLSPHRAIFSRKNDKNRDFLHISPLYIKVGQILGLSKNGSWVLVDAHRFFFMGHELEHAQEALEMC